MQRRNFVLGSTAAAVAAAAVPTVAAVAPGAVIHGYGGDLQALVDSMPDGATMLSEPTAIWHVPRGLTLAGRHGITLDFNGATIVGSGVDARGGNGNRITNGYFVHRWAHYHA